jgi:glucose/mannose-6-phosphate isomerase
MDNYLSHIKNFNRQLSPKNIGFLNGNKTVKKYSPDSVIIVGMGGSALGGNIVRKLANYLRLDVPVIVHRNYGLPKLTYKKPIFVFVSASGNTKETLSGLKKLLAGKRRPPILLVASGGEILKLGRRYSLPTAVIPGDHLTPRESLGYTYHGLIQVLRLYFPKLKISDLSKTIKPSSLEGLGRSLARKVKGRIPLFYVEPEKSHIGYALKIALNETGKYPAFLHLLPEMDHNEIVSFEKKSFPFFALFVRTRDTSKEILKRIKVSRRIIETQGFKTDVIDIPGRNPEEWTWNGIILAHFTAFYTAKFRKVDPTETRSIDRLKRLME